MYASHNRYITSRSHISSCQTSEGTDHAVALVVATVQRRFALIVVHRTPGAPTVVHTVLRCADHLQESFQCLRVAEPLPYLITAALHHPGVCS